MLKSIIKIFFKKILGVRFDQRMTWAVHIAKIRTKCDKVLNVIRSLAGWEWEAEREYVWLHCNSCSRSEETISDWVER